MEQYYKTLMTIINGIPENLDDLTKDNAIDILKRIKKVTSGLPDIEKCSLPMSLPKKKVNISKKNNTFDFNKYKKRHVVLKFLYLGWDYAGLAIQANTDETIESHLFNALMKTKLIEQRESSNYHRCGRTDKGVSAFAQVISLDLRTNLSEGIGVVTPDSYSPVSESKRSEELDYCSILNRVLPKEIRIVAWAPVIPSFSARFDCTQRTYKYWFPKSNLDMEAMQTAAQSLLGEHDFRNLCKMDVKNNVTNFKRRIIEVNFSTVSRSTGDAYDLIEFTIIGTAFLYHQIRCIISVLIHIGQGKEDVNIISRLLDVERNPRKPQYSMASEIPLVLFDTVHPDVKWLYPQESLQILIKQLQALWTFYSVKTTVIKQMLEKLEDYLSEKTDSNLVECLLIGVKCKQYKRFFDRPLCESLESRIAHVNKKQKKEE